MMFTDANRDQWWSLIGTNVRGPFLMTRAVVPQMIVAGEGGSSTSTVVPARQSGPS